MFTSLVFGHERRGWGEEHNVGLQVGLVDVRQGAGLEVQHANLAWVHHSSNAEIFNVQKNLKYKFYVFWPPSKLISTTGKLESVSINIYLLKSLYKSFCLKALNETGTLIYYIYHIPYTFLFRVNHTYVDYTFYTLCIHYIYRYIYPWGCPYPVSNLTQLEIQNLLASFQTSNVIFEVCFKLNFWFLY